MIHSRRLAVALVAALALVPGAGCGDDVVPETNQCPTALRFDTIPELTRADVGSSGVAYGGRFARGTDFFVRITECDAECRRCRFEGPIEGDTPFKTKVCLTDPTQVCEADEECPAGSPGFPGEPEEPAQCRFLFGSFYSGADSQTCNLNYFEPLPEGGAAIQGIYDLVSGESTLEVFNLYRDSTAAGFGVCPNCVGDPTPRDGLMEGTCSNDASIACDIRGDSDDPRSSYTTAMECPVNDAQGRVFSFVGSPSVVNNATTSSLEWTMDPSRPMCSHEDYLDQRCWCGLCDGDPNRACSSDADCGGGTCAGPPEPATSPNLCADECVWNEETRTGTCTALPSPFFEGEIGCFPNFDGFQLRVQGSNLADEGFYISTYATIQCLDTDESDFLNGLLGLPGILYSRLAFRVTPKFL